MIKQLIGTGQVSLTKVAQGRPGESAKYVTVSGNQIFRYTDAEMLSVPTPMEIALQANIYNINSDDVKWYYKRAGSNSWTPFEQTQRALTGQSQITIDPSADYWRSSNSLTFMCVVDSLYYDEITVIKLSDSEAISAILSNETQVIATDIGGLFDQAELETINTSVQVFKGTKELSLTLGNVDPGFNEYCMELENKNNIDGYIDLDTGKIFLTSFSQYHDTGTMEIKITVKTNEQAAGGNKVIRKIFSIAKARQGEPGLTGQDAKQVIVTGQNIFTQNIDGSCDPSSITFTGVYRNLENEKNKLWQILESNGEWTTIENETNVSEISHSENNYSTMKIFPSSFNLDTLKSRVFRLLVGGYSDEISVAKLHEASGYTTSLTNSAHTVATGHAGELLKGEIENAFTKIEAFKNTTRLEAASSKQALTEGTFFAEVSSISPGNQYATFVKGEADEIKLASFSSEASSVVASIKIYLEDLSNVQYKSFSITKSYSGQDGSNGVDGTNAQQIIVNGEQIFKYTNNYEGAPTPTSIKYTAKLFNTKGYQWSYRTTINSVPTNIPGAIEESFTLAHNNSIWGSHKQITLRCTSGDVYDEITIAKLSDGGKGEDGYTPIKGVDYVDGVNGADGRPSYFHVRYSENANGNPMTVSPTATSKYMGAASTSSETAPTSYTSYSWSKVKGEDGVNGQNGINGAPGANGETSYLHIKYSNDGKTFTPNNGEDLGAYIGTYVDFTQADSMTFSRYSWKRFVGADGTDGKDGIDGVDGADGESSYFHVRYSSSPTGANMTTAPTASTLYMGALSSKNPTASTVASDYTWTKVKGDTGTQGQQGVPGANGSNGQTSYLHIKYSDDGVKFTANDGETVGKWIGTYVDFTQADSMTFSRYSWKRYVGEDGPSGANAFTILLTNEAQVIPTNKDRVPMGNLSFYTDILVYEKATAKAFTIGDVTSAHNITVSKTTSRVTFTVSSSKALTADTGTFSIPIIINGVPYTKTFSWSVSKQGLNGNNGTNGSNGAPGENAKSAKIIASSNVFKSTDGGKSFSPDVIKLTPVFQHCSYSNWQYSTNGGATWTGVTSGSNGLTITSGVLTIGKTCSLFSSAVTTITFRVNSNVSTAYDTQTVIKVTDILDLEQEDIFNKLTNNGKEQGLYLEGGKVYLNAQYIKAGTLTADKVTSGTFKGTNFEAGGNNQDGVILVKDSSNKELFRADKYGVKAYRMTFHDQSTSGALISSSFGEISKGGTIFSAQEQNSSLQVTQSGGINSIGKYVHSYTSKTNNGGTWVTGESGSTSLDSDGLRITRGSRYVDVDISEMTLYANTDWAKIGFKNTSDADSDSYMYFETGDNGNEYFKWRIRNSTSTTDYMWLKPSWLYVHGHVEIKNTGCNFIAPNNRGLLGRTTTGSSDYLIWMNNSNQVVLGYNNRTVKIDADSPIQRGGHKLYHEGYKPSSINSSGNRAPQTGRTQSLGGVYTYNTSSGSSSTGAPTTYTSTIGFGSGPYGTVEIAGSWVSSGGLWYRQLRDTTDNWYGWKRIYTSDFKPDSSSGDFTIGGGKLLGGSLSSSNKQVIHASGTEIYLGNPTTATTYIEGGKICLVVKDSSNSYKSTQQIFFNNSVSNAVGYEVSSGDTYIANGNSNWFRMRANGTASVAGKQVATFSSGSPVHNQIRYGSNMTGASGYITFSY